MSVGNVTMNAATVASALGHVLPLTSVRFGVTNLFSRPRDVEVPQLSLFCYFQRVFHLNTQIAQPTLLPIVQIDLRRLD